MDLTTSIPMRFYLLGYSGVLLPRALRRFFARTAWHRGWLAGHMGLFEQNDVQMSVCSRDWYRSRQAGRNLEAPARDVFHMFLKPYSSYNGR